jgi:3-hydroxyisobutyryl-CoA hydrolase
MVNCVIVTGAGPKAFCAGGDVAILAQQNATGREGQEASTDYFALEYKLDHLIATYPKPYIAIMDGITMGGGVGLSVHAPFRIATERTVFAMPETTIGLFPDVGGSFFLSRLDGGLGPYLALTSDRLTGVQVFYHGIATHYMHSSTLAELTNRLSEIVFRDTLDYQGRLELINDTLAEYSTLPPEKNITLSGKLRAAIDSAFALPATVSDVLSRLEAMSQDSPTDFIRDWAAKTHKTLMGRSPTSMAVTLRQLTLGSKWGIAETFKREHVMAARFMRHPDFTEGVTARLIKRPATDPTWDPATPGTVSNEAVDEFFERPNDLPTLALLKESETDDYTEYPHAWTALPKERDIEAFVRETEGVTKKAVIQEFLKRTGHKAGVEEKVTEVYMRMNEKAES